MIAVEQDLILPCDCRAPSHLLHELDIRAPIREQLANLVILEYPWIHVFLPSHSFDFDVIKGADPCQPEMEESVTFDQPRCADIGGVFPVEELGGIRGR